MLTVTRRGEPVVPLVFITLAEELPQSDKKFAGLDFRTGFLIIGNFKTVDSMSSLGRIEIPKLL